MERRSFIKTAIAGIAGLFCIKKTKAKSTSQKAVYKIWVSGIIYFVVAERLSQVHDAIRKEMPEQQSLENELALYGSMWVRLEDGDQALGMPCEYITKHREIGDVIAVQSVYHTRRQS